MVIATKTYTDSQFDPEFYLMFSNVKTEIGMLLYNARPSAVIFDWSPRRIKIGKW